MTSIFMHVDSFTRLEAELRAIDPQFGFVLMQPDGSLTTGGRPIDISAARPDVAWLNTDMYDAGLTQACIDAVLAFTTVKWLQTFHAGLDKPYYQDIRNAGIRIARSGAQAIAIAEYVIANVLAQYQGIFTRRERQQGHRWQRTEFQEIWGSHWLIVGFGNIGQALAQRLQAFECQVTGVRRSLRPHPLAQTIITQRELGHYLKTTDVVVLACTLTDETRAVVDSTFFRHLKPGALLVNVARGPIIDSQALIRALENGIVAHAILDVFDIEPLPADSPFWDMENVTVTSHTSNAGSNTPLRGDLLFVDNLRRFTAGEPLLNEAVN